ncbi:(deoxy)nucleoside triphosphate pyrophosphohydrolase [Paenibacillus sp. CGMCC 1.16610]|uniref:8-oxo-dGTP diphosphatase n=1 Tax=Paenibacillus anseongense TaxID=2682845 RepID=A0ABW9TZS9_9BACL|nr:MULTISPECIES: (deoxy)nucleoside triphosphate pyrophosphohydrolase [Paenibacillus]MBA2937025.1 (deoxy)nucleoside triphosphate pyrophosphohydrolase [Paenibacillus sp. CGMCC 1.16610]MVQ33349.1 NUDIX domain-containing protein [Paenibacillus anseongense]
MKQVDVVGAVLINGRDEVLCALRSMEMSLPGYWEFPGGKIEQGEDQKTALIREIKEELLCDIEVGEFITDNVHEYPNIKVRLITYKAKIISGEPIATEHEKLAWIQFNNLRDLRWAPADIPTLDILCR